MSLHYLDGHVDLHIGGIDLRFPHHENERAQSNPVIDGPGDEAVDLWLHGEHLLFEGRKMSKSAGNVVLLQDVIDRGFDPLAVRFCLMENRYRSQMDLSWDSIAAADKLLQRWRRISRSATASHSLTERVQEAEAEIVSALSNDLDSPRALQILRSFEKDVTLSDNEKASLFLRIDRLLGLDLLASPRERALSPEDEELLAERVRARSEKNFEASDRIRDLLAEHGIEVRDLPTGQHWQWR